MRSLKILSAAVVSLFAPVLAHATTLSFTYSGLDTELASRTSTGTDPTYGPYTLENQYFADNGTISLSYNGNLPTVSLADLTSFSIYRHLDVYTTKTYTNYPSQDTTTDYGSQVSYLQANYTQTLSALQSFSAQVDPSGDVTSLSFATTPVYPETPGAIYQYYSYPNGLDATTNAGVLDYNSTTTASSYPTGVFTSGLITQSPVPEPACLGGLASGAVLLLGRRRKV